MILSTSKHKSESGKATGPKTVAGKERVRYNALQHGFYSKQLIIQESEKSEFESLRKTLHGELAPETIIQIVAFERLLCAVWRVKQSLRMEERALKLQARYELEEETKEGDRANATEPPRWYTSGRGPLTTSIKLLSTLRAELVADGGLHLEERKEGIVKVFGNEFYDLLAQWRPGNTTAIKISEYLTKQAEKYAMPLPETIAPGEGRVVVDPRAKWEMMIKLVDLKLQDLAEIHRVMGGGTDDESGAERRTAAIDVSARYRTTAVRELERAADWYLYLRGKGL